MGLPCPNIYTGGHSCHLPLEWISVPDVEKSAETIIELVKVREEVRPNGVNRNLLYLAAQLAYGGVMNTINDSKLEKLLSSGDDEQSTAEQRAWMNEQIKTTLSKKAHGDMTYTSLDEVRREFGFDAS